LRNRLNASRLGRHTYKPRTLYNSRSINRINVTNSSIGSSYQLSLRLPKKRTSSNRRDIPCSLIYLAPARSYQPTANRTAGTCHTTTDWRPTKQPSSSTRTLLWPRNCWNI